MDPQTTLMTIPLDLHVEILSFVPARHLLVYSRCCKHFKTVTEDDRLWWTTKAAIPVCIGAGDAPEARLCVTAVIYQNSLIVHGGDSSREDKIDGVKRDLWAFQFQEGGNWTQLSTSTPTVTEHTAVLYEDSIYLFGGNSNNGGTQMLYNKVISIELGTNNVEDVKLEGKNTNIPRRRSAHTAVVYKDKMYIYGGWEGRDVTFGDFHELDLKTSKWKPVKAKGESPGLRRAHCAVVHEHYMYLFGGYSNDQPASKFSQMHRFDFEKKEWETFFGTGEVPSGRSRAAMVVYQDKIYVLGGWDRKRYFSDLCEFNIQTHAWRTYKTSLEDEMKGICQHKCVMYKHWLMVVFGYSAKEGSSTNNLFAINLRRKKSAAK